MPGFHPACLPAEGRRGVYRLQLYFRSQSMMTLQIMRIKQACFCLSSFALFLLHSIGEGKNK